MRLALVLLLIVLGACGFGGGRTDVARALALPGDVGPLCGDPAILGYEIGDVAAPGGCGIEDAVRVHAVGGIRLSPSARLNCRTAAALRGWAVGAVPQAAKSARSPVVGFKVAASYACRSRNGRSGARLSEHAKGNAIDISEVRFADGTSVPVEGNWRRGRYARVIRALHKSACGPFGVVLGPDADRYHQDHLHFDTSYLDRPYCR